MEQIEAKPKREARALTLEEPVQLMTKLQEDEKTRRRDLPDLVFFMFATGVRIGEALALVWSQVDFQAGTVQITSTLVRQRPFMSGPASTSRCSRRERRLPGPGQRPPRAS